MSDEAFLDSWGFLKHYEKMRTRMTGIAKAIFLVLASILSGKVSQKDCEHLLIVVLNNDDYWQKKLKSMDHIKPILYKFCTESMARYLLKKEWEKISGGRN